MVRKFHASGTHVAVLMGGLSAERIISLDSGQACAKGLEEEGFQVTCVDVGRNVAEVLARVNPDVVFNALHGVFGEDGKIQGILEFLSLPYTHSGVFSSALAMHKERAKSFVHLSGVSIAESFILDRFSLAGHHPMTPPYVVKPVGEGSSLGVFIVQDEHSFLPKALFSEEWAYGNELMVERYVHGKDLTCAVMGDVALEVCEIIPVGHSFYDYDSKYLPDASKHQCPANIPFDVATKIQEMALAAHVAIGCRGISRSDFRYDDRFGKNGEIVWLEINTQPGMTSTSLVPDIALQSGYSFNDLLCWIVEDASCCR